MQRISVIIPTLNEEKMIQTTLREIGEGVEIIVVDGGSTDNTVELAKQSGARVFIPEKKGRSNQMNCGAEMATGDIVLFLHADTLVPEDYRERIIETLACPGTIAGAFALRVEGEEKSLRFVEKMVEWRSRFLSLPYGDQGIFLRAKVFREMGGFADLPIMEDFEFVKRLQRRGKIILVPRPVVTSGRRWRKLGVWKTTLINQLVILGYYLKVPPLTLARLYRSLI
ncbi:TIGR04283 family arsenosugar biosynthesis glycosyltransferase [Pannus brasiliensis CCIBt3594]|uniref:4,4'-diaponeurosporenoate glycosyltransferase n=1 Tax=Pannus brasiliensis CCIBt3594 TaxID=1427578 RepID=A0AAW9QMT6_9CHRO